LPKEDRRAAHPADRSEFLHPLVRAAHPDHLLAGRKAVFDADDFDVEGFDLRAVVHGLAEADHARLDFAHGHMLPGVEACGPPVGHRGACPVYRDEQAQRKRPFQKHLDGHVGKVAIEISVDKFGGVA